MITLFDNEQIMEAYGREREEEGRIDHARETAYELQKMGLTTENIARVVKVNVDVVKDWLTEPQITPAE